MKGTMTVSKLVAIILAIVVLIFLIFGASQLNPLFEKVGIVFDNVLYFFKIGVYNGVRGCTEGIGFFDDNKGKFLLNELGVPGEDFGNTFFMICGDGSCGVDFQEGVDYRISKGKFESTSDDRGWVSKEDWVSEKDYSFMRNAADTKKDWEIYNGVLDLIERELGVNFFQEMLDKGVHKTFVLYGDSSGLSDINKKYAVWEENHWFVKELGKESKSFIPSEDSNAIDYFVGLVKHFSDDDVYFAEGKFTSSEILEKWKGFNPAKIYEDNLGSSMDSLGFEKPKLYSGGPDNVDWKPISVLVGGDNYKLDKTSEVKLLKDKFAEIKRRLLEEAEISDEDYNNLSQVVDGKTIEAAGIVYTLSLEKDSKGLPLITIVDGSSKYFLSFSKDVEVFRTVGSNKIWLRYYPLKLIDSDTTLVAPSELDYKLPKAQFDELYKLNLIEDFIRSKCR
jgi:hypothetical protein